LVANRINGNVTNMNGVQFLVFRNINDVTILQTVQMVRMKWIVRRQVYPATLTMVPYSNALTEDNALIYQRNVMESMIVEI
uniref:VP6 n=1 Tax=Brugia timori TaxID=42155 RepID=A0A0R3RDG4_9BILA